MFLKAIPSAEASFSSSEILIETPDTELNKTIQKFGGSR
jgi:hypothetical protein